MPENPYQPPQAVTPIASRNRGVPWLHLCVWVFLSLVLIPAASWLAGAIVWTSGFTRIDNETLAGWATLAALGTGLLALFGSCGLMTFVLLRAGRDNGEKVVP
jgi:hypothetical protein